MHGSAIHAHQLRKAFGEVVAVDAVDLSVDTGHVHGLLGPNGAGKTTILRMLFGLVRPDGGTISLLGEASGGPPPLDHVAGFVEEPRFYPYLSASRNLEILSSLDREAGSVDIAKAVARVGLDDAAGKKVGTFSTGMRLRLGLAAALVRSPRLLLLDEPLSGLDPAGASQLRDALRVVRDEGVTVLLSSHDMNEIEAICDSVTIMRRGSVVWDGTLGQLRAVAPVAPHRMSTSDDEAALNVARLSREVDVILDEAGGLEVTGDGDALDAFVLALARSGVAVRRLEPVKSPLEAMFYAVTDDPA
jgi:ABC-2 type transport system ATP-binding protein